MLAIVNMSAFAVVLMDQIVETVNFKRQRKETERKREPIVGAIGKLEAPLAEIIMRLIRAFRSQATALLKSGRKLS